MVSHSIGRQHVLDAGERASPGGARTLREGPRWAGQSAKPATGDVLASRPTARADVYAISRFPSTAVVAVRARYTDAIETVREMARRLGVNGWFTCDHTHWVQVATHRGAVAGGRAKP